MRSTILEKKSIFIRYSIHKKISTCLNLSMLIPLRIFNKEFMFNIFHNVIVKKTNDLDYVFFLSDVFNGGHENSLHVS